jgi:hypothetical protein
VIEGCANLEVSKSGRKVINGESIKVQGEVSERRREIINRHFTVVEVDVCERGRQIINVMFDTGTYFKVGEGETERV